MPCILIDVKIKRKRMIELQPFMTTKDWIKLVILMVISVGLWAWVWMEYKEPIIDPTWVETMSDQSVAFLRLFI